MKYRLVILFLVALTPALSQQSVVEKARAAASGNTAYEVTDYVEDFWRLAGNPGFDSSIYHVASRLRKAGFVPEKEGPAPLTYRIERRPLSHPAWEPVDAELILGDETVPLLEFGKNRNMIAVNSHSTPPGGVKAEVVHLHSLEELGQTDVRGKIVFAEINPYYLFRAAVVEFGALGILTYEMPEYLDPETNSSSIQFRRIMYSDSLRSWSVALSFEAKEKLLQYLEKGPGEVTVRINTRFVNSDELTLVARVRGNEFIDQEVVISAHVQEPGANDNASGVGAATEIAEILASLVTEGSYSPKRTITLLWGDEIRSTHRYVEEHGDKVYWGFSLDMVGENTAVTGGSFLIEKMPDPSAIWTRGEDKHTEWGGSPISRDRLKPHYLNDFVINRFSEQGSRTGWEVNTNPFEGGSDHVPFLDQGIPSVLFWHFTDQFYHTDADRIDKVSRETLKNVVAGTLSVVIPLASGEADLALNILAEIEQAAKKRIDTEIALSLEALKVSGQPDVQQDIIATWTDYYYETAATVTDLAESPGVQEAIRKTQKIIREYGRDAVKKIR